MVSSAQVHDVVASADDLHATHATHAALVSQMARRPWAVVVSDDMIEIQATARRTIPLHDPANRELVVDCGAAVLDLRAAASTRGLRVDLLAGPGGRLLARLRLANDSRAADVVVAADPSATGEVADAARPTARRQVPAEVLAGIRRVVRDEGAHLLVGTTASVRSAVAELARSAGERAANRIRSSPAIAVLWTDGDQPPDWLAAGQGLERARLVGAAGGVRVEPVYQFPVESVRHQFALALGFRGHPQSVLRIGWTG